jgi:hypothetical protein
LGVTHVGDRDGDVAQELEDPGRTNTPDRRPPITGSQQ